MPDPKAILLAAIDAAESGPFDYLLYGGMVAAVWGEPRYTEDVDMVLFLHERDSYRFLRQASIHGFAVDESLALRQIQVNGWARLPLGSSDSPWHLDLTLGDSPFDRSALERRLRVSIFDREVWVASPEDMIIYKLVAGRERDLQDIQVMVRRQTRLDAGYLRTWADWWGREGVEKIRERLESALSSPPTPPAGS